MLISVYNFFLVLIYNSNIQKKNLYKMLNNERELVSSSQLNKKIIPFTRALSFLKLSARISGVSCSSFSATFLNSFLIFDGSTLGVTMPSISAWS